MSQLSLFPEGQVKSTPTQVDFSSESNEFYTPRQVVEAARNVLIEINLDPASCELANTNVKADRIYTIHDDGLNKDWKGNWLCNPPGGKVWVKGKQHSQAALWWDKAYEQWQKYGHGGIFVAFNPELIRRRTTVWEFPFCIPFDRLSFLKPVNGVLVVDPQPPKFNVIIHLPSRKDGAVSIARFYEQFEPIGIVNWNRNSTLLR